MRTRKFNGVQILEGFKKGPAHRESAKFDFEVKLLLNVRATDTIDHWEIIHCLSNGIKFGHVSPPLPRKLGSDSPPEYSFFHYARYLMHTTVCIIVQNRSINARMKCLANNFLLAMKIRLKNSKGFKFYETASVTTPSRKLQNERLYDQCYS
jgi:hypothetical protein